MVNKLLFTNLRIQLFFVATNEVKFNTLMLVSLSTLYRKERSCVGGFDLPDKFSQVMKYKLVNCLEDWCPM